MVENSAQNLEIERGIADRRSAAAAGRAQARPADVLSRSARRQLADAITSERFRSNSAVGRTSSQQERWKALVQASTKSSKSLGFVKTTDGTHGLALQLGVGDQSTWSRSLKKWSTGDYPLVVFGMGIKINPETGKGKRGHPHLQIVQIPLLTEWLLWVAEANAIRLNPMGRDYLWESHIRELSVLGIRELFTPPSLDISRAQADRDIEELKQGPISTRRSLR